MNRELSVIIVLHDICHCLSVLLTTTCSIFSLSCISLIFSINGFNFFLYIWLFISILPVSAIAPFSHPLTKSSMTTNIFHRSALTLYSTKPTSSDTTSMKLHSQNNNYNVMEPIVLFSTCDCMYFVILLFMLEKFFVIYFLSYSDFWLIIVSFLNSFMQFFRATFAVYELFYDSPNDEECMPSNSSTIS